MHKNSNLSVAFCASYTYDALGRPVTRGADRFGYNGRSEVVSALTDGIAANYAYDAIGNTVVESGAMSSVFPFRFSTKYYDAESGLYYYGYRFYSPKLGRWLTRDPIEEAGGVNLYGFCGNDGVGKVDVLGTDVWIERTSRAFWLHYRVCVDTWEQAKRRQRKGCCLYQGTRMVKKGKFCISFGPHYGLSSSSSSSKHELNEDSSPLSAFSRGLFFPDIYKRSQNELPLPDGMYGEDSGYGIVYEDDNGTFMEEIDRITLPADGNCKAVRTCAQDMEVLQYFRSLEDRRAPYWLFGQNCRRFPREVFEKAKEFYEKREKDEK